MTFGLVFDLLVFAWLLSRQRRIRPAPRRMRLPIILGMLGIIEVASYTHDHPIRGSVLWVEVLVFVVGAVLLAGLRAYTVRLWAHGPWILRQGTWTTIALWVVAVALHFAADTEIGHLHGPPNVASSTLLLYLAVSLAVQQAVLLRRTEDLRAGRARGTTGEPTAPEAPPPNGGPWGPGSGPRSGQAGGRAAGWLWQWVDQANWDVREAPGNQPGPGRGGAARRGPTPPPGPPGVIDVPSSPVDPTNRR